MSVAGGSARWWSSRLSNAKVKVRVVKSVGFEGVCAVGQRSRGLVGYHVVTLCSDSAVQRCIYALDCPGCKKQAYWGMVLGGEAVFCGVHKTSSTPFDVVSKQCEFRGETRLILVGVDTVIFVLRVSVRNAVHSGAVCNVLCM